MAYCASRWHHGYIAIVVLVLISIWVWSKVHHVHIHVHGLISWRLQWWWWWVCDHGVVMMIRRVLGFQHAWIHGDPSHARCSLHWRPWTLSQQHLLDLLLLLLGLYSSIMEYKETYTQTHWHMNIGLDFVVFNHSYEANPFEMETIFDIKGRKKIERERMDCWEWELNGMEGGREDNRNKKGSERIWAVACGHQVQDVHVTLLPHF